MSFAPQQNWTVYQALTKDSDRQYARNLSIEQRFALYEDLFAIVCCRRDPTDGGDRAEQRRWAEKLALRRKLINIFLTADQRPCG